MESKKRTSLLLRFFAEFLAIFAGVVLALTADGWAERRSEREEARAGLELVRADLEADSIQFGRVRVNMTRWMRGAAWLIDGWDRVDLSEDSVELAFHSFTVGETLQFSRSGFEGLRDANRLRFVDDPAVRFGLMDYYQRRQPQLRLGFDNTIERVDELYRLAAPYVRYEQSTADLKLSPVVDDRVSLRGPWADLAADPVLYTAILLFGRWAGYEAGQLEIEESELSDLLGLIRAELEDV